jgi:hypothetical protein
LLKTVHFWDGFCRAPHFTFELTPTRERFVTPLKSQLASVLNNDARQTLDSWVMKCRHMPLPEDSNNKHLTVYDAYLSTH